MLTIQNGQRNHVFTVQQDKSISGLQEKFWLLNYKVYLTINLLLLKISVQFIVVEIINFSLFLNELLIQAGLRFHFGKDIYV